jgi:hypothetical protein
MRAIARLRHCGSGTCTTALIQNISSTGVYFTAEVSLDEGSDVELLVDWPVNLNDRIPIMLVLSGIVVRLDSTGTAVRIKRYDWRVRGKPIEGTPGGRVRLCYKYHLSQGTPLSFNGENKWQCGR